MRRFVAALLMMILSVSVAFADDNPAKIKIKISGGIHDNSYFLCMPDMGCLSILAAKKGKVFKMMNQFEMNTLFIMDRNNMSVHNQGLPASCDVKVKNNQTITISGSLAKQGDKVKVNQLRCSVS